MHESFFVNRTIIKVGKDSDAGMVSQLPVCYLQRPGFAPVRVTGTGTGHLPIAMSDEEARPPLNIPSPKELTESDDERPQSAQKPDTSNALNADSDRPVVSAISASEAMETADSGTKPRISWHTIQVMVLMDRDVMNDHVIQARRIEVACQVRVGWYIITSR